MWDRQAHRIESNCRTCFWTSPSFSAAAISSTDLPSSSSRNEADRGTQHPSESTSQPPPNESALLQARHAPVVEIGHAWTLQRLRRIVGCLNFSIRGLLLCKHVDLKTRHPTFFASAEAAPLSKSVAPQRRAAPCPLATRCRELRSSSPMLTEENKVA